MSDRRLQVFHTVGRMLSFTKAAEVLQMTQPAVTFQIRQLEEQLNIRLFDRSHNRIDLTEAGKHVFEYAERIFALYSEMENALHQSTGSVSGLLRIGASTTSAQYYLPSVLSSFQANHPDVRIQMKVAPTSTIYSLIENSFVDVGVVEGEVSEKKFISAPYCQQELVVCMSRNHYLAGRESLQIGELIDEGWIVREEGSTTRDSLLRYASQNGVDCKRMQFTMELGCPEAIKAALASGRGISVLPREAVAKELQLGSLVVVPLSPSFTRPLLFIQKEQKFPLRTVDELIQFAQNYRKEAPEVRFDVAN